MKPSQVLTLVGSTVTASLERPVDVTAFGDRRLIYNVDSPRAIKAKVSSAYHDVLDGSSRPLAAARSTCDAPGKSSILAPFAGRPCLPSRHSPETTAQRGPPDVRDDGWVSGIGGASFGIAVSPTRPSAVEYGDDVSPHVQAYLTLTYFENVMTQSLQDDMRSLSQELTAFTDTRFTLRGRDQAVTLLAGGRYLVRLAGSSFRPYVGGGGGVINCTADDCGSALR